MAFRRFTIELSGEKNQKLERIATELNKSASEVIRNGIDFYAMAVDNYRRGYTLYWGRGNDEPTIELVLLDFISLKDRNK